MSALPCTEVSCTGLQVAEPQLLVCRHRAEKSSEDGGPTPGLVSRTRVDAEGGEVHFMLPPGVSSADGYVVVDATGRVVCGNDSACPLVTSSDVTNVDEDLAPIKLDDAAKPAAAATVFQKLGFLDRYLALWIITAMILGVVTGNYSDRTRRDLNKVAVDQTSLPIAIGLWLMMTPVFAKVNYGLVWELLRNRSTWRELGASFVVNWIIGPAVMTACAWAALPDLPGYRGGVILVGIARCIAMVLIWNQLAGGNRELCSIVVAFNSLLSLVLYAPLAVFYLQVVSRMYLAGGELHITFWQVLRTVLIFLGVPLVAGFGIKVVGTRLAGHDWYNQRFLPVFGPVALLALLYTIFVMFALQGRRVLSEIGAVARVAVPMATYFAIMWAGSFAICLRHRVPYRAACVHSFTASSNNFELAIAIAVGTFGIDSQEALAATIGPLIEVPVLLALVHVALWLQRRFDWAPEQATDDGAACGGACHTDAPAPDETTKRGQ